MDKVKRFLSPQVLPLRPLHAFEDEPRAQKGKVYYDDAHLEQSDTE